MNRLEFIVATTIILFVAFGLGWFSCWILHRFSRIGAADMNEVDRLAQALHEAEETRDQALIYIDQREAELANHITQTEAELRAAMDGLRDVRHEAEELRAYIDRLNAS
jgi:septal ring factor EnvC (AmiA/AmiB activator)